MRVRVMVTMNFIEGTFRGLHLHTKKVYSLQWRLPSQLTLIVKLKEILPYIHFYYLASAKILTLVLSLWFPYFTLLLQPCSSFLSSYLFSFLWSQQILLKCPNNTSRFILMKFWSYASMNIVFTVVLIVILTAETTTDWWLFAALLLGVKHTTESVTVNKPYSQRMKQASNRSK